MSKKQFSIARIAQAWVKIWNHSQIRGQGDREAIVVVHTQLEGQTRI